MSHQSNEGLNINLSISPLFVREIFDGIVSVEKAKHPISYGITKILKPTFLDVLTSLVSYSDSKDFTSAPVEPTESHSEEKYEHSSENIDVSEKNNDKAGSIRDESEHNSHNNSYKNEPETGSKVSLKINIKELADKLEKGIQKVTGNDFKASMDDLKKICSFAGDLESKNTTCIFGNVASAVIDEFIKDE